MGNLMDERRRILSEVPRLRYATGSPIMIHADRAAKLPMVIINCDFVQGGSGTPSPSNVRQITGGLSDFTVGIASAPGAADETVYSLHLQDALYSGYLNGTTTNAVNDKRMVTLDGDAGWAAVGSKFYVQLRDDRFVTSTATDSGYISNMYLLGRIQDGGSAAVNIDKRFYLQRIASSPQYCRVWVYDSAYTLAGWKELLNATPLQVTYPISPVYMTHDPLLIKTRMGDNYIRTNGGNLEIRYYEH